MLKSGTMHISAANWSLGMGHALASQHDRFARLRTWTGERPRDNPPDAAASRPATDRLDQSGRDADPMAAFMGRLARHARSLQVATPAPVQNPPTPSPKAEGTEEADSSGDPKTNQIRLLLEKMFGIKRIDSIDMRVDASHATVSAGQVTEQSAQVQGPAGWGMEYDYRETYAEAEVLSLAAKGTFTTDDGRSFAFNLDYRMERTYVAQRSVSMRAGNAVTKDPLMLDLGGRGGGFSPATNPVDLDGDGRAEALPQPKAGNWYLLRDGLVPTSGRSLFGPSTGQGFQELAALDADGNGFVDGADPGFAGLHLWNGQGDPVLLAAMGVGAIGTKSTEAPFRHADLANTLQGLNRRSGIYLMDDGRAGAVHQVDVAV